MSWEVTLGPHLWKSNHITHPVLMDTEKGTGVFISNYPARCLFRGKGN